MKSLLLFTILLLNSFVFAKDPPSTRAIGYFFAVSVGPRMPIFDFSNRSVLGYGVSGEISYTDNKLIPFFLFAKLGFEQFPGSQEFYRNSDYTHFSVNYLPVSFGIRDYLPPVLKNIVTIIPVIEVSASMLIYQEVHDFKDGIGKSDFLQDGVSFGGSVGAGVSMFLLEFMVYYNYFRDSQFLSADLRLRLPLYVSL